jgi:hypothetical protein
MQPEELLNAIADEMETSPVLRSQLNDVVPGAQDEIRRAATEVQSVKSENAALDDDIFMSRSEFDSLSPSEQAKAMEAGRMVVADEQLQN